MAIRWPRDKKSKVSHELHSVHKVPHSLQGNCKTDGDAKLRQECSVGSNLDSATCHDSKLETRLVRELFRDEHFNACASLERFSAFCTDEKIGFSERDDQFVRLVTYRQAQRLSEVKLEEETVGGVARQKRLKSQTNRLS